MADDPNKPLANISAIVQSLGDPLKATFLKAASRLLGGLISYPAAHLRRFSQAVEDTTDAKTIVSSGLAEALVEKAKADPALMDAVAEAYMPDAVRKIRNKVDIVLEAAEHIRIEVTSKDVQPADPDEDWMNAFIRHAEDASSERLKKLFSKILAGEIVAPGSFAPSTLRVVSELNMETAKDFSELYARTIEDWFYRGEEYQRGAEWSRVIRLQEAGFVSPTFGSTYQPRSSPGVPWQIGSYPCLLVNMKGYFDARYPHGKLTRTGVEVGRLLPRPDVEKNLRAVAVQFPRANVEQIVLLSALGREILYPAGNPSS